MKITNRILAFVTAMTIAATGCVNESPTYAPDGEKPGTGTYEVGYLDLSSVRAQVLIDAETSSQKASAQSMTRSELDLEPAGSDYLVRIYNSKDMANPVLDTTVGALDTTFGDDELLELETGNYVLEVLSAATFKPVSYEDGFYSTDPYYEFTVTRDNNATNPVEIPNNKVVCKLQSVKVTVELSADLQKELNYKYTATVTMRGVDGGVAEFNKDWDKGQDEYYKENLAYLKPANAQGDNTLDFVLTGNKTLDGSTTENATLKRTIEGVQKGQWRKIAVSVAHSTTGEIIFDVKVETLVMDSEVTVDGVGSWQEPVLDEAEEPELRWEGYDLMKDIFSLDNMQYNEYGEFTGTAPTLKMLSASGLKSVKLTVASSSTTVEDAVTDLELVTTGTLPSAYGRLKIAEGATEVAIDLSKLLNIFYDKEDTHTLKFVMTDMKGKVGTGVFTIVYGEPEDPLITCAQFPIETPKVIAKGDAIDISIKSSCGITALWVEIESEVMDEATLAAVNLKKKFNLCDIEEGSDMAESLTSETIGFPINGDVIGQTNLPFPLTKFVDMLIGLGTGGKESANHVFKLTVVNEDYKGTYNGSGDIADDEVGIKQKVLTLVVKK